MPHVNIQCYPKHLNKQQLSDFSKELTDLIKKHLSANDEDISIDYTEIQPEEWKTIYIEAIKPRMNDLLKKPGYKM